MKEFEVAVAYTDHTWDTMFVKVPPSVHPGNAEEHAEETALKKAASMKRAVAFVKVVWESPEEEE